MSTAETMRYDIARRAHCIASLMRASDLVMNESGEPDPQRRVDIACDLMSCAQEYADLITNTADAMEQHLSPA